MLVSVGLVSPFLQGHTVSVAVCYRVWQCVGGSGGHECESVWVCVLCEGGCVSVPGVVGSKMKAEVMLGRSPGLWLPEEGRSWQLAGSTLAEPSPSMSCRTLRALAPPKDHAAAPLTKE